MMMRILTAGACAMVATLLLSSDASACGKRRAAGSATYSSGTAYGGYAATSGSYDSGYGYAPSSGYAPGYNSGYGYGGYDFGRPGYNPGGLGGPRSGLGVRPGLGLGGFGLRR